MGLATAACEGEVTVLISPRARGPRVGLARPDAPQRVLPAYISAPGARKPALYAPASCLRVLCEQQMHSDAYVHYGEGMGR